MAISSSLLEEASFFQSEVDDKNDLYESTAHSIVKKHRRSLERNLQNLCKQLIVKEEKLLKYLFGENIKIAPDSDVQKTLEKEFNKRKKICDSRYHLDRLSGAGIRPTVFNYDASVQDNKHYSEAAFRKFVKEKLDDKVKEIIAEGTFANEKNPTGRAIEAAILYFANEEFKEQFNAEEAKASHRRKIYASPKLREKTSTDDLNLYDLYKRTQGLIVDAINRGFKTDIKTVGQGGGQNTDNQKDNTGNSNNNQKDNQNSNNADFGVEAKGGDIKDNSNSVQALIYIDWYEITNGKKGSDSTVDDRNNAIINFKKQLAKLLGFQSFDSLPRFIRRVVNYVLNTTEGKSLFVGKNYNAITGILGEIQALCYLRFIFDERAKSLDELKWTATQLDKYGHQFHADIILNDIFGIQVKNTTKDIPDSINFEGVSLEYAFDNIIPKGLLSPTEKSIFLSLYSTASFNIPYAMSRGKYYRVSHSEYSDTTYSTLIKQVQVANKLLELLINEWMYIGLEDSLDNENGNLFFMVAGKVWFASTLISKLISELHATLEEKGIAPFTIDLNSSYNIINFLNIEGDSFYHRGHNGPTDDQRTKAYSQTLKKAKLTSAYNFATL